MAPLKLSLHCDKGHELLFRLAASEKLRIAIDDKVVEGTLLPNDRDAGPSFNSDYGVVVVDTASLHRLTRCVEDLWDKPIYRCCLWVESIVPTSCDNGICPKDTCNIYRAIYFRIKLVLRVPKRPIDCELERLDILEAVRLVYIVKIDIPCPLARVERQSAVLGDTGRKLETICTIKGHLSFKWRYHLRYVGHRSHVLSDRHSNVGRVGPLGYATSLLNEILSCQECNLIFLTIWVAPLTAKLDEGVRPDIATIVERSGLQVRHETVLVAFNHLAGSPLGECSTVEAEVDCHKF